MTIPRWRGSRDQVLYHPETVLPRHPHVEQSHIETLRIEIGKRLFTVAGLDDIATRVAKQHCRRLAKRHVVIGAEHP